MSALAPGVPCYLTALADFPELTGRVVEVVRPAPAPDGEAGQWYQVRAPWTLGLFGDRANVAPRCCLRPIIPPEPALPAARKRTKVPAC